MTRLRWFTGRSATRPPRRSRRRLAGIAALGLIASPACGNPSSGTLATGSAAAPADLVYVLDANRLSPQSSVFVVDPATRDVVHEYSAGRDPAMALSPDGTRLFLASRSGDDASEVDRLEIIDTATHEVVRSVTLEDRWGNTLPAYFPTMEVSRDARWIYVLQARTLGPDDAAFSIATVDVRSGRALPESASVPGCGAASMHSLVAGPRVDLLCHSGHDARFVTVSERGSASAAERVALPKRDDDPSGSADEELGLWRLSAGAAPAPGRSIYAVTQNGHVSVIDVASRRIEETVDLGFDDDDHVAFNAVAVSPEGDRLYLGVGGTGVGFSRLSAEKVVVVDTSSWERVGSIKPDAAFEGLAVSPSSGYLYAVDTETASVLVLDPVAQEQVDTITGLGKTPTLAEVVAQS